MEPKKGQRIIYFDQWYSPRAHDLYFLCHVDRSKDQIWWGIGTPNKDLVDQIPDYAAFEELHKKQQLANDSVVFLSGPSAVHSHTARKAQKAIRTVEVYARNFSKIRDLFGKQSDSTNNG